MRVISWKCRRSSPYGRVASTAGVSTQPTTSGGSGSTSNGRNASSSWRAATGPSRCSERSSTRWAPALQHGGVVDRERRAVDLGDPALRVRAAELLAQQRALADAGLADQQVVPALPDARRHLLAGPQERREQLAVGPDAGLRVLGAVVAAQVLGVVAPRRRGHVRALPAGRLGQARRGCGPGREHARRSASPPSSTGSSSTSAQPDDGRSTCRGPCSSNARPASRRSLSARRSAPSSWRAAALVSMVCPSVASAQSGPSP